MPPWVLPCSLTSAGGPSATPHLLLSLQEPSLRSGPGKAKLACMDWGPSSGAPLVAGRMHSALDVCCPLAFERRVLGPQQLCVGGGAPGARMG